jgi:hypothetical protein
MFDSTGKQSRMFELAIDNLNKEQKVNVRNNRHAKRFDGTIVLAFITGPIVNPNGLSDKDPLASMDKPNAFKCIFPDNSCMQRLCDSILQRSSKVWFNNLTFNIFF